MRRVIFGTVLAASLLALAPVRAETIAGSEFSVGIWKGIAARDPESGIVLCQVSLSGAQGERIDFGLRSDDRLAILIAPIGARFQSDQPYDLSIWTDSNAAIAVSAQALGEQVLVVELTDIDRSVGFLKGSQTLTVTAEEFHQVFQITGVDEAIKGAQTCLQTHTEPKDTRPKDGDETEIEGSRFTISDNWWGGATALQNGQFDYCGVSIGFSGTTTLSYILRSDDMFVMIASLDGASFPTGEVIEAILMGETFGPDKVRARVVNPTTISIPMPGIKDIAGIIRQNGRISIEVVGRQPDVFRTPDADAALDAAMACFDKYSAPDVGSGAESQATATNERIEGSQFSAGIWRGFAMRNAADNSVTCHVSLRGAFEEQIDFILGSDNRFLILMALSEARLQKGQVYDVSIRTNVENAIAVPATAFDTKTLAVVFTDIEWAVSYLEGSQSLTVTGETFDQLFSIANANLALDAAKTCLATHAPG
jgi:hypothetical protein